MALESTATGPLSPHPHSADLQRCDHVVPLQQPDGKRITGACRVYLVGSDGINMHFAGGCVRIRTLAPSCHYHPLEPLTRYGAGRS